MESEFRKLLVMAIGEKRNQKEFARDVGIAPEYLSRIMKHPDKYRASEDVLRKIAEASEGRVHMSQLINACEHEAEIGKPDPEFERVKKIIKEFRDTARLYSGRATRYGSIREVLDMINNVMYGKTNIRYKIENEEEYLLGGHAGAEKAANITVEFATEEYVASFGFVLYYCETKKDGIIFSDAAFDRKAMMENGHSITQGKLLPAGEEITARYQTICIIDRKKA